MFCENSFLEERSALLDDFRTFYASGLADEGPLSAPNKGWLLTARNLTNFQLESSGKTRVRSRSRPTKSKLMFIRARYPHP
jgi:hypothetical protein